MDTGSWFLSKLDVLINKVAVYGDKKHLNAKLPPTDPNAGTEWSYLTTDQSDDPLYAET